MVNLAAMVWRRLLRKRWVLALVFGLSLVYFLTSTFKQEERAVRDRNLLQVQDHDQPILWKVQFNLGNSSRPSNQCRNSIQGKHLITDELGYVCERKDLLVNGCCNVNVPGTKQYCCDGCLTNGCCSAYEHCVSCCLQPNKQLLLERFLNRAAVAFQNLFMAVEDHFELCLAKCRTSSQHHSGITWTAVVSCAEPQEQPRTVVGPRAEHFLLLPVLLSEFLVFARGFSILYPGRGGVWESVVMEETGFKPKFFHSLGDLGRITWLKLSLLIYTMGVTQSSPFRHED
ncbi:SREBP regulating gene protein isoform X2 [Myotis daubentonii]|uniref:SREBP regulating gene protein isoform X2 n=1 Tax=Myotis daubentonii TaxID=98922 RepID=UPI00287359BB|nr:SREBP regulating gene protein isoform X2 [Myotis daubentonii]